MHGAIWYETESVCALASAERHLGHIVVTAQGWIAYDGTHTNPAGDGFDELGSFADVIEAKAAVEEALGFRRTTWERQSARYASDDVIAIVPDCGKPVPAVRSNACNTRSR